MAFERVSSEVSVLSSEYLETPVSSTLDGRPLDVTDGTIEYAFLADDDNPSELDWHDGEWDTTEAPYIGRILIGPEGVALAVGLYTIWVRITLAPQAVVEPTGLLEIY
jgi:hypothetical protein